MRETQMLTPLDPLSALRRDYPDYEFSREPGQLRGPAAPDRFTARAARPGLHPHTVITADPDELRAALASHGR
jgi:hypothetical protein